MAEYNKNDYASTFQFENLNAHKNGNLTDIKQKSEPLCRINGPLTSQIYRYLKHDHDGYAHKIHIYHYKIRLGYLIYKWTFTLFGCQSASYHLILILEFLLWNP